MTPAERHKKQKRWMYKSTHKGVTAHCWELEAKGESPNIQKANETMPTLPPWVRCTLAEVHEVIQQQRAQGLEAYDHTQTHAHKPSKAA